MDNRLYRDFELQGKSWEKYKVGCKNGGMQWWDQGNKMSESWDYKDYNGVKFFWNEVTFMHTLSEKTF